MGYCKHKRMSPIAAIQDVIHLLEDIKTASGIWYGLLTWNIYSFNLHHRKELEANTFTKDSSPYSVVPRATLTPLLSATV